MYVGERRHLESMCAASISLDAAGGDEGSAVNIGSGVFIVL